MPNGDQIINELEFKEFYRKMPETEREYWIPKEIFFISQTVKKLSDCERDIEKRLTTVENSCVYCTPESQTKKAVSKTGAAAIAGGGLTTGVAIAYLILELLGKIQ